jgi:hypothetical protein
MLSATVETRRERSATGSLDGAGGSAWRAVVTVLREEAKSARMRGSLREQKESDGKREGERKDALLADVLA